MPRARGARRGRANRDGAFFLDLENCLEVFLGCIVELGHRHSCFAGRATLQPHSRNKVRRVGRSWSAPRWPHDPAAVWRIAREIPDADAEPAARVDTANEPRELAWTSRLALDDEGADDPGVVIEVQWWFRLAPNWTGTEVEHGVRIPRDFAGAEAAAVRRRLVARLASVKARAESMT